MRNPDFIIYNAPVSPIYLAEIRRKFYFVDYYPPATYPTLSRYRDLRRVKVDDEDYNYPLIHETFYDFKIVESDSDTYYTVSKPEEGRLDIISLINYKNHRYWWIIALANDIIDPMTEVVQGKVLRIPSIMSIYEVGSIFGR